MYVQREVDNGVDDLDLERDKRVLLGKKREKNKKGKR